MPGTRPRLSLGLLIGASAVAFGLSARSQDRTASAPDAPPVVARRRVLVELFTSHG